MLITLDGSWVSQIQRWICIQEAPGSNPTPGRSDASRRTFGVKTKELHHKNNLLKNAHI